jgi:hypothetical protein
MLFNWAMDIEVVQTDMYLHVRFHTMNLVKLPNTAQCTYQPQRELFAGHQLAWRCWSLQCSKHATGQNLLPQWNSRKRLEITWSVPCHIVVSHLFVVWVRITILLLALSLAPCLWGHPHCSILVMVVWFNPHSFVLLLLSSFVMLSCLLMSSCVFSCPVSRVFSVPFLMYSHYEWHLEKSCEKILQVQEESISPAINIPRQSNSYKVDPWCSHVITSQVKHNHARDSPALYTQSTSLI